MRIIMHLILLPCFRANTAVDEIASHIASSLSSAHIYSKSTSNGPLPPLPIGIKPYPHLNMTARNSASLDGKSTICTHTHACTYTHSQIKLSLSIGTIVAISTNTYKEK